MYQQEFKIAKAMLSKCTSDKLDYRFFIQFKSQTSLNGVTLPIVTLWRLSDPRIAELHKMPRSLSNKLHSETQVSGRLGMSAQNPLSSGHIFPEPLIGQEKENALNNPPCPINPTLTSSFVHHFISSIDYNFFIVIQCHLKDLLCRKVT